MLGGQSMIVTPTGPAATAVVLTPCGRSMSLAAAVRASHVYSTDDEKIDPMIMDALDQQCQSLVATTRRIDLTDRSTRRVVAGNRLASSVIDVGG
jgi:hypothetical protein